jgi:hypothetical protein
VNCYYIKLELKIARWGLLIYLQEDWCDHAQEPTAITAITTAYGNMSLRLHSQVCVDMTIDRAVRIIDFKVNYFSVVNNCSNLVNALQLQGNVRIAGSIFKRGRNFFCLISSFTLILMIKGTVHIKLYCWKRIVKCPDIWNLEVTLEELNVALNCFHFWKIMRSSSWFLYR